MKRFINALWAIIIVFGQSCKEKNADVVVFTKLKIGNGLKSYLNKYKNDTVFMFNPNSQFDYTSKSGVNITVFSNSFLDYQGNVKFYFRELRTIKDIILSGLHTESQNGPMITSGMYQLNFYDTSNTSIFPVYYTLKVPPLSDVYIEGMALYKLSTDSTIWVPFIRRGDENFLRESPYPPMNYIAAINDSTLGFINTDSENLPNGTTFGKINLRVNNLFDSENTMCFLVYPEMNIVDMFFREGIETSNRFFETIINNQKAWIVTLSYFKNKIYFSKKHIESTDENTKSVEVTLEEIDEIELINQLNEL